MATIERFEDLICWQESRKWAKAIYSAFKECRDFAFRDQIQRAAVSAMNNIADDFPDFLAKKKSNFLT